MGFIYVKKNKKLIVLCIVQQSEMLEIKLHEINPGYNESYSVLFK